MKNLTLNLEIASYDAMPPQGLLEEVNSVWEQANIRFESTSVEKGLLTSGSLKTREQRIDFADLRRAESSNNSEILANYVLASELATNGEAVRWRGVYFAHNEPHLYAVNPSDDELPLVKLFARVASHEIGHCLLTIMAILGTAQIHVGEM